MDFLPPLVIGPNRWHLPLGSRAATVLVDAMLAVDSPGLPSRLADVLADDPALTVWMWVGLHACGSVAAQSFADLAGGWGRLESAVHWARAERPPEPGPAWPARLEEALVRAEVVGHLAGDSSQAASWRFRSLIDSAKGWLREDLGAEAADLLESALPDDAELPSRPIARQAEELLTSDGAHPSAGASWLREARAASRRRVAQWSDGNPAAVARLKSLSAKLARLGELEHAFAATLQRAKLDSLAEFAAGAGHEINNPLTVIAGRAQLFLREETDPERRRGLALINAQAMRIYEMIADLRLFARPPAPHRRPVELVGLVDQVLAELGDRADEQRTVLARKPLAAAAVELIADPTQLSMALRVLCLNALESLEHEGRIEVTIDPRPGEVRVSVWDDGPGFDASQREHLFDPFYSARQAGRGLGLGLSKCWRIMAAHGGRVDADCLPGQGTTFTLVFPEA